MFTVNNDYIFNERAQGPTVNGTQLNSLIVISIDFAYGS